MEKKIPKLTVQLLAAIAMTLALVMVVENYFSIRISETLQVQFGQLSLRLFQTQYLSCLAGKRSSSLGF
ncbi:hypothetical protein [Streptococcus suis]|uniref:Membrane protein n=1 Tax=Streptococcus suis TaxID=1307 RepID=A0AB33U2Z8_STRSU|nr:hypothetical protein [Streptococcus suis]CYU57855.1 membrane protein [Streptococcus suis]